MKYEIEKGMPFEMPMRKKAYPFKDMEIGDSFLVKFADFKKKTNVQSMLLSMAKAYAKRNNLNWIFVTKKIDDGIRIWRIK